MSLIEFSWGDSLNEWSPARVQTSPVIGLSIGLNLDMHSPHLGSEEEIIIHPALEPQTNNSDKQEDKCCRARRCAC